MFKASRYLEELSKFRPDILEACRASTSDTTYDLDFLRINNNEFIGCPSDSIDFAVMEKTADAVVVSMDVGWSDLGSWKSLWDICDKDNNGNVIHGDVMHYETRNSLVIADEKLVTTVGVDNLIVVSTKDAIMVAHKDAVQDIKIIVEDLKRNDRTEWNHNREVHRPWGKYDSIDNGSNYQVKRITVKPGGKLSLQKHHHRSEHWIVVSGLARVTNGDKIFLLKENQSTYIPLGEVHALENPGKTELQLIEVQSGTYLGEDDIVRFEDIYGRIKI
jgi:mannose-1-phosphate guanylyltransferase